MITGLTRTVCETFRRWVVGCLSIVLVAVGSPTPLSGQKPMTLAKASITAPGDPTVIQVPRAPQAAGLLLTLDIDNYRAVDLDMFVYASDPDADPGATPVCTSKGEGPREQCRAFWPPAARGLWVSIRPLAGRGKTEFTLSGTPIPGRHIVGTSLTTSDARPVPDEGSVVAVFREETEEVDPIRHLYQLSVASPPRDSIFVSLLALGRGNFFHLRVLGENGLIIREGQTAGEATQVALEPSRLRGELYVLVELARRNLRTAPQYRLEVATHRAVFPIEVSLQPFRDEGFAQRDYEVRVPLGFSALVQLEEPAFTLHVTSSDGLLVRNYTTHSGTRTAVYLGRPFRGSERLYEGLEAPQTYSVKVRPREGEANYGDRWRLEILGTRDLGPSLLQFAPDSAVTWELPNGPRPELRKGVTDASGTAVFWIPAPRELTEKGIPSPVQSVLRIGPKQVARLTEAVASKFDLAACDERGRIISIGGSSVTWEWTPDRRGVFLVVFPDPARVNDAAVRRTQVEAMLWGV